MPSSAPDAQSPPVTSSSSAHSTPSRKSSPRYTSSRDSIRDESMRAYDAGSIPGMRRTRSDDARVIRWVSDAKIDRLVKHISIRPISGNTAANALKRQLLCAPVGLEDTLNTLDALMRKLPYFYRYLATARFFNALWNAYKSRYVNADAKAKVLILIKAWAEDLHRIHYPYPLAQVDDPAAIFWIEKYQKKRKYTIFPKLPTGIHRPFLCPVSTSNPNPNNNNSANNNIKIANSVDHLDNLLNIAENDGDAGRKNVAKEARHLYQTVIASVPPDSSTDADDNSTASTFLPSYQRHSIATTTATMDTVNMNMNTNTTQYTDGATVLLLPKRAGRANPKAAKAAVEASRFTALNHKVLAVLRRYDESFGRNHNRNFGDRPLDNNGNSEIGSGAEHNRRSSTADIPVTVAAKARTEARWKLSMSGSGWSTSTSTSATHNHTKSKGDGLASRMESFSIDSTISFPAITPATFPSCPFENDNLEQSKASVQSEASQEIALV